MSTSLPMNDTDWAFLAGCVTRSQELKLEHDHDNFTYRRDVSQHSGRRNLYRNTNEIY
jgi:hypothetical protein